MKPEQKTKNGKKRVSAGRVLQYDSVVYLKILVLKHKEFKKCLQGWFLVQVSSEIVKTSIIAKYCNRWVLKSENMKSLKIM